MNTVNLRDIDSKVLLKECQRRFGTAVWTGGHPEVDTVIEACCLSFGSTPEEVRGDIRERRITWTRSAISNILRHNLGYTLTEIGKFIEKNHTSVLFAIREHPERLLIKPYKIRFDVAIGRLLEMKSEPQVSKLIKDTLNKPLIAPVSDSEVKSTPSTTEPSKARKERNER